MDKALQEQIAKKASVKAPSASKLKQMEEARAAKEAETRKAGAESEKTAESQE